MSLKSCLNAKVLVLGAALIAVSSLAVATAADSLPNGARVDNVTLSGTQTRGQGTNGTLKSDPVSLPKGGQIVSHRCNGDGFWIEGPQGTINFPPSDRWKVQNFKLSPGTYKAFPKLKVNQDEATVSLTITPF